MSEQTAFSAEYIVSLLFALGTAYIVSKANPNMNFMITYVLAPLAVAYSSLQILNLISPHMNKSGAKLSAYIENKTLGEINNMGYIQIFPPLFAVTILVFVLLFTNKLI